MNKDKVINNIKATIAELNMFKWELEIDIEEAKNNKELSLEEVNIMIEKGNKDIESIDYILDLIKKLIYRGGIK